MIINIFDKYKIKNSAIIINISSQLHLINVNITPEIEVSVSKVIDLPINKREDVILDSFKRFIKDNNIKHRNIIISLSLNNFQIKRLSLPVMPEKEIIEAIKLQVKDELNFDTNQAIIDFKIINRITKEDGSKSLEIIIAAAKSEDVESNLDLFKNSDFNILAIGVLPFGYASLIERYIKADKGEPVALLHIDKESSFISVYQDNNLCFFRELPISLNIIKNALSGILVSDKGRIELSPQEIDEILFKIGIPLEGQSYKQINSVYILSLVRPHLERMGSEINRSFKYCESKFNINPVRRLYICGAGSRIVGLNNFISGELKLNIYSIDFSDRANAVEADISGAISLIPIKFTSNFNKQEFYEVIWDLFLIFDYQKNINLLPKEYKNKQLKEARMISARIFTIIVFLLLFTFYVFVKVRIDNYQKRFENSAAHLNILSQVKQVNSKVESLRNLIDSIRNGNVSIVKILKILSNVTPKELFFREFILSQDSKTGTIKGFVKSIKENNEAVLNEFIKRLEKTGIFFDISISSVEKGQETGTAASNFEMNFKLK